MSNRWVTPKETSGLDRAFGPRSIDDFLPVYSDIPDEFKKHGNKWSRIGTTWFFKGLPKGTKFLVKEGIDKKTAIAHLSCVLGSWEPKHERKEAGVGYLMSLWFDDVILPEEEE